jgi:threonine aldolase
MMPDMIPAELKERYQALAASCRHRITGHPTLSMALQLEEIGRWAARYDAQDLYGTGELIESFQRDMAELLGKPAAVFLVSGTMAQNIALRLWADRAGQRRVGFHHTSHLQLHEHQAYRELYGLDGVLLGDSDRVPALHDLQNAGDLAAVLLELPMREIGGQLPEWDDLHKQADWARGRGIKLHMDGARLWQCPPYYGRSMAEIADLFDSVYVSFYKDIGGIAGSVLAGPEDFIEAAKVGIARAGGSLYSLFPYVLAARAGLERNFVAMPEAVDSARWLAAEFRAMGFKITPELPPTNLFHLHLPVEPEALVEHAIAFSEQHDVFIMPMPRAVKDDHSVMEFSLGRAIQQQSREQWQEWLQAFYTSLPIE